MFFETSWRSFTLEMFLSSHLRLQFWILYYKVLRENEKCLTTNDHMKSLQAAKIREIQTLYCNGLDLERPLMLSLSPCSDKHKQEVIGCINDFAKTFSSNFSQPSLCRYSIRFFFPWVTNPAFWWVLSQIQISLSLTVTISPDLRGKGQHYKRDLRKRERKKVIYKTLPPMICLLVKCCLRPQFFTIRTSQPLNNII